MTEYEIAQLINRVTGLIAAFFTIGLAVGYARVIRSEAKVVRMISWSILLMTVAVITECLRVVPAATISMHLIAIVFNLLVLSASLFGLHAQHQMIPEEDRPGWQWFAAPLYPPWVWVTGVSRFVQLVTKHRWVKSPTTTERRDQQKPIDFPDRRRNK